MKRFKGFTLAELMVALAVIGIIVAIVTPAIMKTRPNKNKMMVKKTYYTIEKIVSELINDNRLYPDMRDYCYLDASDPDGADCAWGFDYTDEVEFEGVKYSGDDKFAKLFASKLNVTEEKSDSMKYYFTTTDGVKWEISTDIGGLKWSTNKNGKFGVGTFDDPISGIGLIGVDVNGDEDPNLPCTAENEDCDTYVVEILANGKMRINPNQTRAIEYVTINTSIKDSL